MDFNAQVGEKVKRVRRALGMTQAELAAALADRGLPFQQQTILKVERGSRPLRFEEARAIAEILNTTTEELSELSETEEIHAAAEQLQNALHGIASRVVQKQEIEREIEHYQVLAREAERRLTVAGAWHATDGNWYWKDEDGGTVVMMMNLPGGLRIDTTASQATIATKASMGDTDG